MMTAVLGNENDNILTYVHAYNSCLLTHSRQSIVKACLCTHAFLSVRGSVCLRESVNYLANQEFSFYSGMKEEGRSLQ